MIGDFTDKKPSDLAMNASLELVKYIKLIQRNLTNEFEFITHNDAINNPGAATLCPGKELYAIWKEYDDFVNQTSVCNCTR